MFNCLSEESGGTGSLSQLAVNHYFRIQIIEKFPIVGSSNMEEQDDKTETQKLLMVRTKNLVHDPFESTQEIKVSISDLLKGYMCWF